MMPWQLDLAVQRWTPFVYLIEFPVGVDLSAATLHAQVRLFADHVGLPLIDLLPAAPQAEGLSVTNDLGDGGVVTSTLQLRINETTIENLPFLSEIGDPQRYAWDLHITIAGVGKLKWIAGAFTVLPGVTH